jgi:hypothetical protein
MRLSRFRLRALMAAVAVVGVAMGGERMRSRRVFFLQRAKFYAGWEWRTKRSLEVATGTFKGPINLCGQQWANLLEKAPHYPRKIDYYTRMRVKYERAARYPWLRIPPDPPEPE